VKFSTSWTSARDLDSLPSGEVVQVERRLNVVGECDGTDPHPAAVDVEAADDCRCEVEDALEVRSVDAARRIQHENYIRLVHALCTEIN